jgi:pyruvate dehydrogenase E1 component alpha subunit
MLLMRAFEDALVRGPLHLATWQDAVAAGVCAHPRGTDLRTSTHRGHGHTLAQGSDRAPLGTRCGSGSSSR